MKHWVPDEAAAELCPAQAKRQQLSAGSKAGLALVALGCAAIVLALNAAFGRADVFADETSRSGQAVTSR